MFYLKYYYFQGLITLHIFLYFFERQELPYCLFVITKYLQKNLRMNLDFDITLNVPMMEYTKENHNFALNQIHFIFRSGGKKINTC